MSGHSKWATIKRAKGANDAKRGNTFTKIANFITIASRLGGSGDPNSNPRLRLAVEQARSVNMPKDNIQRAIDRGLGNLPGQNLEEVLYEGFGPARVAFIIEGITDNKMRTLSEVRNLFDKSGGSLGSTGSVAYMFDKKGEIKVTTKGSTHDDEILELIDLGAEDVEDFEENGTQKYLVYTDPHNLNSVHHAISEAGFSVETSEIIYKPNMTTEIKDQESAGKLFAFAEKLEDHDDIHKVYSNFDIPEEFI